MCTCSVLISDKQDAPAHTAHTRPYLAQSRQVLLINRSTYTVGAASQRFWAPDSTCIYVHCTSYDRCTHRFTPLHMYMHVLRTTTP